MFEFLEPNVELSGFDPTTKAPNIPD